MFKTRFPLLPFSPVIRQVGSARGRFYTGLLNLTKDTTIKVTISSLMNPQVKNFYFRCTHIHNNIPDLVELSFPSHVGKLVLNNFRPTSRLALALTQGLANYEKLQITGNN